MKILVVGAGAMGSLFAGKLVVQGADVTLFNRENEHTKYLSKHGLQLLEGNDIKTIPMKVITNPNKLENYDIIFVLVKAFATEAVLRSLQFALRPDTIVLSLQNGLGNLEKIQEIASNSIVRIGGTGCGAGIIEKGMIEQRAFGKTYIGTTPNDNDDRLCELAGLLSEGGLDTYITEDIQSVIWSKLIVNIAYNGLTALTRLKNGDVVDSNEGKKLMKKLIEEAAAIAEAEKVSLKYKNPVEECVRLGYEDIGDNKSSMLTDVMLKRRTEIDFINGAIVKLGRKHRIPTPYNESVTCLIKMTEQAYSKAVTII